MTNKQQIKLLKICFSLLVICAMELVYLHIVEKQQQYYEVKAQKLEQLKIQNELEKEKLELIKHEQELRRQQLQNLADFIHNNKSKKSNIEDKYLANRIVFWANTWNLQPEFLASLICTESNFYQYAKSYMDCRGLGQASKETWDWFNAQFVWPRYKQTWSFEVDVYDIDKNLQFTCWYINKLFEYEHLNNDLYRVLIAYNAGPYSKPVRNNIKYWGYSDKIIKMTDSLLS